jgi:hypothetical protein
VIDLPGEGSRWSLVRATGTLLLLIVAQMRHNGHADDNCSAPTVTETCVHCRSRVSLEPGCTDTTLHVDNKRHQRSFW